MYIFQPSILDILQQSGWSPDRSVDVTLYQEFFEQTHQPTSDIIIEFLQSFVGLEIKFHNLNRNDIVYTVTFDPLDAEYQLGVDMLQYYKETYILKPLCIVGDSEDSKVTV